MVEYWIKAFTLFIITLGFAGLLGDLLFQLRSRRHAATGFLALLIGSLVFFPPLSLPHIPRAVLWTAALTVILLFTARPNRLPQVLLSQRFILRYACLGLVTTALWYLSVGQSLLMSALAISALFAALLSWRESLQW